MFELSRKHLDAIDLLATAKQTADHWAAEYEKLRTKTLNELAADLVTEAPKAEQYGHLKLSPDVTEKFKVLATTLKRERNETLTFNIKDKNERRVSIMVCIYNGTMSSLSCYATYQPDCDAAVCSVEFDLPPEATYHYNDKKIISEEIEALQAQLKALEETP